MLGARILLNNYAIVTADNCSLALQSAHTLNCER